MKITIRFFILFLVLTSCGTEESITEVVLDESIIPENATNVSLRPTFGFQSIYGGLNTTYKFLCDTITPPQREVASTSGNVFNIMCFESEMLQPNKKYYWLCKALKDGYEYPTDIYTFTTIDTSILNGNHWHYQYVLSKSDYEKQKAREYYNYDLPIDSCFIYSEPYGFTIVADSVKDVYRDGDYLGILPTSGSYSFDQKNMKILDWTYQFVNLGINYYDFSDNHANKIVLVLKQPYSDNVVIFIKSS